MERRAGQGNVFSPRKGLDFGKIWSCKRCAGHEWSLESFRFRSGDQPGPKSRPHGSCPKLWFTRPISDSAFQSTDQGQKPGKGKTFEYEYQGFGQVVDLSVSGNNLLAVNIYDPDTGMRSMLLEITDSGFKKKAKGIKYMLSFMGPADNDKEPVLWGQRFSRMDLLLPVVFRLKIQDDAVSRGQRVDVPFGFSLIGAFLGDVNNNDKAEMGFFNPGGQLVVQEQGAQVWESTEKFAPPPWLVSGL